MFVEERRKERGWREGDRRQRGREGKSEEADMVSPLTEPPSGEGAAMKG